MTSLIGKLLKDERGFIVSGELVLVATTLVLGCIAGLSALSYSLNSELCDMAAAYDSKHDDRYGKDDRRGRYGLHDKDGKPEIVCGH